MAGLRRGGAWASALSADGFAALRSVGFEPAGQVFGAAVYQLNATAGVSCPGTGARSLDASPEVTGIPVTAVPGLDMPGPAARIALALHDGRRLAFDRMAADCAELGGHGVVGASVQVHQIPADNLTAGAVEFTVIGTAVRASGCPPPYRPFAAALSGQDFAKLIMGGWVPAGIALGISVAALHDDGLMTGSSGLGVGNVEVPAYTELIVTVRHDARSRLEQAVRGLGADGVVVSAMTLRVHGDACRRVVRTSSPRQSSPVPPWRDSAASAARPRHRAWLCCSSAPGSSGLPAGRPARSDSSQPRSTAVWSRPSGGEPRSSRAVWNLRSEKPAPQLRLACSRRSMISSFPHVYLP